jgi:DNA repair protein RAD50
VMEFKILLTYHATSLISFVCAFPSGQAFVHDPASIGSSIVKANVKLRFTNRSDKTMVVVRSMEVQKKKTTLTFRQLDGVLRMTNESGERTSLSHKCTGEFLGFICVDGFFLQ